MGTLKRRIVEGMEPPGEPPMDVLGWIPVRERLPDGRQEVLGWQAWVANDGWGEGVFVCHRGTKSGEWYSEEGRLPNITHWMPLPEPPN